MQKSFNIDVDYNAYDILRFNSDNIDDIEKAMQAYGAVYIRSIIEEIGKANQWSSKNVRRYVYNIIEGTSLHITDPMNGSGIRLGATYTFDDFQTIFFFFGEENVIGIVASDLAAGFPLSTIIFFNSKTIVHLTASFWGLGERHFQMLSARGEHVIRERPADCGICLVTGDPNFAHHAWNELSALQEIVGAGLDRTTSLVTVHEPLGPVNDVLGSQFNVVFKLTKAEVPEVNRLGALTFCATGTFIDADLVDKIIDFAEGNLSSYAVKVKEDLISHAGRSLWVSVRTRNRTLNPQTDILATVIIAYLQGGSDRMVVIDGHSFPFDHELDAPYIQELNEAIVQDDNIVADQIIATVKQALPTANVVKFLGQKIHESIAVGRHAGFYFCHHGTVQHKLGWFSDVQGIVHCNRETLAIQPDIWVSQQSEIAALPVYIPSDLIEEVDQDKEMGELQLHLKHIDYTIADVSRLAGIIAEFAQKVEQLA